MRDIQSDEQNASTYYLNGVYQPGISVYGMVAAQLQLSSDNVLTLITVSGSAEAPQQEELFRTRLADIQSASILSDYMYFVVDGKKYRFTGSHQVNPFSRPVAPDTPNTVSMPEFYVLLHQRGLEMRKVSYGKLVGVSVVVILALTVIAAIFFA